MSKKEKITRKSNYEVLLSSDASEAQGFFFEGGDDHALVVFRDEEDEGEMSGTGIPWSVLGEAMGTNEQLGGVQEWLERWMKKSGNQNLKILIIRKMTFPMRMMKMKNQF